MQVSVFYLPSIVSRGEIEKGIADLSPDLYQQMLEELRERTPVRWLFAWTYNGLTPHDKIVRSLELFATKVPAALRGRAGVAAQALLLDETDDVALGVRELRHRRAVRDIHRRHDGLPAHALRLGQRLVQAHYLDVDRYHRRCV